jgi:hypothetical protein
MASPYVRALSAIHSFFIIFIVIAPYLTNHPLYLSFLVFIYILLLTSWSIYGECVLSGTENVDAPLKYWNGSNKSFASAWIERVTGCSEKVTYYGWYWVIVINSAVALWGIRRSCFGRR